MIKIILSMLLAWFSLQILPAIAGMHTLSVKVDGLTRSCDLVTEQLSCQTGDTQCLQLSKQGYSCGIFQAGRNCLAVDTNVKTNERNVILSSCNNTNDLLNNDKHLIWTWSNRYHSMRPLQTLEKCLTFLGNWWSHDTKSFDVQGCTGAANQNFIYDVDSQLIANSDTLPITTQRVVHRYGNNIIDWNNSKNPTQFWDSGKSWAGVIADKSVTTYPAKLEKDEDGNLTEPLSVTIDRIKSHYNNFFATQPGFQPLAMDYASFPGEVPANAVKTSKTFTFDLKFDSAGRRLKNWMSTGLYIPPNQAIRITMRNSDQKTAASFNLQIGTYTDSLNSKHNNVSSRGRFDRTPIATNTLPVNTSQGEVTINVPLGGLLMLTSNESQDAVVTVTVENAIAAPFYDGTQTQAQWDQVCKNPVPYGQVAGDRIVISDKTTQLCQFTVNELAELRAKLDSYITAHDWLGGYPKPFPANGQYQMTYDPQISAGYGHAGFPIMTMWNPSSPKKDWGNVHELGHENQVSCFSSRFGVEVTVNLYSQHWFNVSGKPNDWEEMEQDIVEEAKQGTLDYDNDEKLMRQLIFLLKIKRMAGWDAYRQLYSRYRTMSTDEYNKNCKTPEGKLDYFYQNISEIAGIDFTKYFEDLKLPVSAQAKQAVANLKLPQPSYDVATLRRDRLQTNDDQAVILQNPASKRYVFSRKVFTAFTESDDWTQQGEILGTDANYYGRAAWYMVPRGKYYILQNVVTEALLYSSGSIPIKKEKGWLNSPPVVGVHDSYINDDRALWEVIKYGNLFQLRNVGTGRYLFQSGQNVTQREGGWKNSPKVLGIGSDVNYYGRGVWAIRGKGSQALY